jgi:hypothetical protein
LPVDAPTLRLDDVGKLAAARHIRDGERGARLMNLHGSAIEPNKENP